MSLNSVSYIIEKEVNKVIYSKDIDKSLIRDISFLKSDQRILFIYDKNIVRAIAFSWYILLYAK